MKWTKDWIKKKAVICQKNDVHIKFMKVSKILLYVLSIIYYLFLYFLFISN